MLYFIVLNRRTKRMQKVSAFEAYFYASNKFGNIRDFYVIANAETHKLCFIEDILREIDRNKHYVKSLGSSKPPAASRKEEEN